MKTNLKLNTLFTLLVMLLSGLCSSNLVAEEKSFDIGLRYDVLLADGEPANDIMGLGIYGKYYFSSKWLLGFGLDFTSYDFENPAKKLGLEGEGKIVDASAQATLISVWAERAFPGAKGKVGYYLNAGAGINSVDVDDATGPIAAGGTFYITTDAGTEFVLLGNVGLKYPSGTPWAVDASLGFEYHIADWTIKDRDTGNTATISDYLAGSARLAVVYSF